MPLHAPTPRPAGRRAGAAALATAALAAALTGCATAAGDPAGCPTGPTPAPALILLVGVHANAPTAGVPAQLACDVQATLRAGNPVSVVSLDGDPAVEATLRVASTAQNGTAFNDDVIIAENEVISAVRNARASSDGSNLVAGFGVAADLATSAGAHGARIVLIDSGLPDRGALNMTVPGMIGADPDEVADFLADQGVLRKVAGMTVDLVGVGYTTSPQEPLSPAQIDNVTQILTAALERADATVRVLPVPRTGDAPDTPYTTTPAPLPAEPVFDPGTTIVYDDTTALGFRPDTTQPRDPDAARARLATVAGWLTADPDRRAIITGTCASAGTRVGRARLSHARADAIKTLLVGLGVDPDQLTAKGAGYIADPPDRRPDGTLDPAKAAHNRSVRITTTETP